MTEIEDGSHENGKELPNVAGKKVVDGLADVGIDPPSLSHRRDDGGKIVVGEDHIGRSFGYIGARFPHGTANVGGPEGGGVVDPIPGHGYHPTLFPPGLHDAGLMLRGDPGKDGEFLNVLLQKLLRHEVQLSSRYRQVPLDVDAQLPGDGHGGEPVVPGDHHRLDPGGAALGHGGLDLGPGRVHHAHKA